VFNDLLKYWNSQRIAYVPAKLQEVEAAESSLGTRFPDDFRRYLLEVNGTRDMDTNYFEFYPLDKLKKWTEVDPRFLDIPDHAPDSFRPEDFLVFADYLQLCWGYAIRIDGEKRGEIIHWGMLSYSPICPSFSTFIELYLADDKRIYTIQISPSPEGTAA